MNSKDKEKCVCKFDGQIWVAPDKDNNEPPCPVHGYEYTGFPAETNSKDTNPKDSVGTRKVPFSTISERVCAEVGLAMLEGARKYGRHNYREVGVRASVYYDACRRHLGAWWEGEDTDPDSGLNHVSKAIACLFVLRDSMLMENWVDDRPPKVKQGWVQELNKLACKIIDQYPDPKDAYVALKTIVDDMDDEK